MQLAELGIIRYSDMDIMDDRIEFRGDEDTWVIPFIPLNELDPAMHFQIMTMKDLSPPGTNFFVADPFDFRIPTDPVAASIRYWSKRYGRTMTREEVLPLMERVKTFYELLNDQFSSKEAKS